MKNSSLLCGLAAACVCGLPAYGQLTHYVPFDLGYVAGADLHMQGSFDLGFGVNVWFDGSAAGEGCAVVAGGLTAPAGLTVAGDSAMTHPVNFDLAFYTFDQDFDLMNGEPEDRLQPGEHWISFIARADTAAFFGGLSLVKFFGEEVLYIGKVGGEGGTEWGVDTGGNAVSAGGDITADTFLVARLTIGAGANDDTVELYVNPPVCDTPPASADLTQAFNEDPDANRGIDEIRIGSQNGAFAVDEIRIGATFADVVSSDACASCPADLEPPFGTLDFFDVLGFLGLFDSMDPASDLAPPMGVFDFFDVLAYLELFDAGCP